MFNEKNEIKVFFGLEKVILLQYELVLTKIFKKMAYVINEDCIACGSCISECPVEAISEGDIYVIDADVCTDCGTCADVCPSEAISPA
jgi:ferredoxin